MNGETSVVDARSIDMSNEYNKTFDPCGYLEHYFQDTSGGKDDWDYVPTVLKFYIDTFSKDYAWGDNLLDLGTGPNLMPVIFASRQYKNIYLSDYAEVNRKYLRSWMEKDADSWDWTPFYKYVAKHEGINAGAEHVENRIHAAVKDVLPCNVLLDEPLDPIKSEEQFDFLIAAGVFESAASDLPTYARCVRNAARLLKPGGRVIVEGDLNQSFYMIGNDKFYSLALSADFIRETFQEAGFTDIEMTTYERDRQIRNSADLFDASGFFHMRAKKRP